MAGGGGRVGGCRESERKMQGGRQSVGLRRIEGGRRGRVGMEGV